MLSARVWIVRKDQSVYRVPKQQGVCTAARACSLSSLRTLPKRAQLANTPLPTLPPFPTVYNTVLGLLGSLSVMSLSTPRGGGRKTACEMCRARLSTPVNHDVSRHFSGDIDSRQILVGTAGRITWDPNSSSAISYNPHEVSRHEGHTPEWMQHFPTPTGMPASEFDVVDSDFEPPSGPAFSATNNWQQPLLTPPSIAASRSEHTQSQPPNQPQPLQSQLPSQERVLEMVSSFFSAQHRLLPSVHMDSFMAKLSDDMISLSSGPFLWVIIALYCSCDKSEPMQAQYCSWMKMAHEKLELMSTARVQSNTTNMLQASIWMVFDAYCRGDVTNAWLLLGRTAQLTSALGLNRIDSKRRTPRMEYEVNSRSAIELEECRKCIWCLGLLDCVIASVNGLALSVDDRYFHVDFPLPDDEFQKARNSLEDIEYLRKTYSSNAFDLLNGNATSTMTTRPSFEHVLKVSVILGRALTIQNSIRHEDDSTQLEKLRALESVLNPFCYAASASGECVGPTSLIQLWLKMLTQCSKIMMLHPPEPSTLGLCDCLSASSPTAPTRTDTECARAAVAAAKTFSHALNETLLALNSPFLLPMACTSEFVSDTLRVVDHIAVKFPGIAAKARETIAQRMNGFEHGNLAGRSNGALSPLTFSVRSLLNTSFLQCSAMSAECFIVFMTKSSELRQAVYATEKT
ncbi:hypothetical protein OPT61_g5187 [Boeremia exigua]|uniref:Uncharacterized protein n=1 Tax=Boeremia exigua TaxID=749465 RepID=A0ACC2IB51_9PLEO|nr:hypothetical protein OPT61_g5187 [Boeremia exigua]